MDKLYLYYLEGWHVGIGKIPQDIPPSHFYKYDVGKDGMIGKELISKLEEIAQKLNNSESKPSPDKFPTLLDLLSS